jgi:hypothetical protein
VKKSSLIEDLRLIRLSTHQRARAENPGGNNGREIFSF